MTAIVPEQSKHFKGSILKNGTSKEFGKLRKRRERIL